MAEEGSVSGMQKTVKEHIQIIYAIILFAGLYLIFIAKNTIAGLIIAVIGGYLLTLPIELVDFSDDAIVAWNEFADEPSGTLVMNRKFTEYFQIDPNRSNVEKGLIFYNVAIRRYRTMLAFEAPSTTLAPGIYFIRADTRPKKEGQSKKLSRFVQYFPPEQGELMPHSDIMYWLEHFDKSEDVDNPKEVLRKAGELLGVKVKNRHRQRAYSNLGYSNQEE